MRIQPNLQFLKYFFQFQNGWNILCHMDAKHIILHIYVRQKNTFQQVCKLKFITAHQAQILFKKIDFSNPVVKQHVFEHFFQHFHHK